MDVREVVARRGDLSTFVVHLTRDSENRTAMDALLAILNEKQWRAGAPMGHAVKLLQEENVETETQNVVCFTETPLEYVYLLLQEIEGRQVALKPYGIAITKKIARRLQINPVWYVDISPTGRDWVSNAINQLVPQAIHSGDFGRSHIARLAPFIEQMGTRTNETGGYTYRKEFWWEREWRHVGDLTVPDRCIVLCPSADRPDMEAACLRRGITACFLDHGWGLERIIASLAGFPAEDVEMLERPRLHSQ